MRTAEIRCHRGDAAIVVHWRDHDELLRDVERKGWDISRGVIACRTHRHTSMMPRHRDPITERYL